MRSVSRCSKSGSSRISSGLCVTQTMRAGGSQVTQEREKKEAASRGICGTFFAQEKHLFPGLFVNRILLQKIRQFYKHIGNDGISGRQRAVVRILRPCDQLLRILGIQIKSAAIGIPELSNRRFADCGSPFKIIFGRQRLVKMEQRKCIEGIIRKKAFGSPAAQPQADEYIFSLCQMTLEKAFRPLGSVQIRLRSPYSGTETQAPRSLERRKTSGSCRLRSKAYVSSDMHKRVLQATRAAVSRRRSEEDSGCFFL